ncbi:carbohydrate ABC transporter permease [Trebonia kvetii]|uniref:Carbohydrate ABC transporter permease n=1 Tax=Trebonia kvetii TaxID=2480626 RepID=A0A6P2BZP9_9ACTN|nr:carbohydrate ABC transporter permease [Trebonia kvetii]TVZ04574.1 carbohydrate ABC transporter permease [Trebonia kvetii]
MRSVSIETPADRLPAPAGRRPAAAWRWRRRYRWIAVAAGAVIVAMTYFPIVFVLSNSLKSGQNIFSSGVFSLFTQFEFQNYSTAWTGIARPLGNTLIVAALSIVLGVSAAAFGAYAFSQLRFRGKDMLFLAYVALLLVPSTLTLIPLFLTVQKLHLFNTWWALVLPYAASAQPLLVLIFRGFFDQIPADLLESARVDGCTEWQVLARIVAPLTRPVLLTGAILVTINVWGDYLWPTIVIQDPSRTTISAGVQQFVGSFGLNLTGGGAVFAAFVMATLPMFVLVGFTMRYFVSGLTEGAVKL